MSGLRRHYRSNRHNFADLHLRIAAVVFALVGDEFGCGGCEGIVELLHGLEVEVADGMVVRGRAGRKRADASIDLNADEASWPEQLARDDEVRTKVVLPVKGRPWSGGIKHAKSDHGLTRLDSNQRPLPCQGFDNLSYQQLTTELWAA